MTGYARSHITSKNDLRAVVDAAGSHFFSPDTMRFFDTMLLDFVVPLHSNLHLREYEAIAGHGFVFVTSERYRPPFGEPEPRLYTTRLLRLEPAGKVSIVDIGEFQEHHTAQAAKNAARTYAMKH